MKKYDSKSKMKEFAKGLFEIESLGDNTDEGTKQDMIPEGYGKFGLEVTNPVPTSSIIGSKGYLGKLHTEKGEKVSSYRLGSCHAPNIKSIIDKYVISLEDKEIAIIYICPYNQKDSNLAPEGFKLM